MPVTCRRPDAGWPAGGFVVTDYYIAPDCNSTSRTPRSFNATTAVLPARLSISAAGEAALCPDQPAVSLFFKVEGNTPGSVDLTVSGTSGATQLMCEVAPQGELRAQCWQGVLNDACLLLLDGRHRLRTPERMQ